MPKLSCTWVFTRNMRTRVITPLCNHDIYDIDMKEFNAMSVKLGYVSIMLWTSFLSVLNPILLLYLIMRILLIADTASVTHWLKIANNPQIFIDNASTCQLIFKLIKMYLEDLLNWKKRNKHCISFIIYTQGCPKSANRCFEKNVRGSLFFPLQPELILIWLQSHWSFL